MRRRYSPEIVAVASATLSVGCFMLSLAMPFFRFSVDEPWFKFSAGSDPWPGLLLLFLGWLWVLSGVMSWLANPSGLVSLGLLLKGRYVASAVWGGIALALALSTYFLPRINVDFHGGGGKEVWSMAIGFYFRLSAILFVFIGSLFCARMSMSAPNEGVQPTPAGERG